MKTRWKGLGNPDGTRMRTRIELPRVVLISIMKNNPQVTLCTALREGMLPHMAASGGPAANVFATIVETSIRDLGTRRSALLSA